MDNRIRQIEVRDRSLIPAEAEVWITVTPEHHTPTTEVRGRLMGPRCPYASTVEVAYPPAAPAAGPNVAGADWPDDARGHSRGVLVGAGKSLSLPGTD